IGLAVRADAPRPDISSGETVKQALRAAKSIAYSSGPSGIYFAALTQRMGIADEIKSKMVQIPPGESVGALVARGEAEIGIHQMSELLPVKGIDIVGPLPPDIQKTTTFSAGRHVGTRESDAVGALVDFLAAPGAIPVIRKRDRARGARPPPGGRGAKSSPRRGPAATASHSRSSAPEATGRFACRYQ